MESVGTPGSGLCAFVHTPQHVVVEVDSDHSGTLVGGGHGCPKSRRSRPAQAAERVWGPALQGRIGRNLDPEALDKANPACLRRQGGSELPSRCARSPCRVD